ncbi:uncharacterized protein [Mytilus edulis]|uniref:uncharacterized protein n=1 Tax=Mytilus edulis TaxID=6550 RepID=UPI0039EE7F2B
MNNHSSETSINSYKHVRSSGYLAPKYRYRNPPSTMSWLEDDIDLNDIEGKDRSKSPEPQLDDFIQKVLQTKRNSITRTKEKAYKSALYLATNIVAVAFENEWLYPMYIRNTEREADLCDFRAVDKNVYVGLVPLRKPIRMNAFMVAYKSPGDLPSHRMLVQINKKTTKEERLNIVNEWGHCLDANGILRPDFVLQWFNRGLIKSCEKLEVENKRTQKLAFLETSLADDGTVWVHIIGFDPQENYKINLVPCFSLTEVPKQLYINAPIPSRRPYNDDQSKFIQEVHNGIKEGEEILFLEARLEKWCSKSRCSPSIEISWGVHIGQLEDRSFGFLNTLKPKRLFEDIIVLINAIKDEHVVCLHAVTNRVINHAVFFQYRKNLGKFQQKQDWFLAVLKTIQTQLNLNTFPNFFLQKQNIFMESDPQILKFNKDEIKRLIICIKNSPESLLSYSGCEETKPENDDCEKSDDEKESSGEKNSVHFED